MPILSNPVLLPGNLLLTRATAQRFYEIFHVGFELLLISLQFTLIVVRGFMRVIGTPALVGDRPHTVNTKR